MENKELTNLINKMKKCYGVMDYNLAYNEVDLLLNYIERLQKENEELKQQDKNKDTRNSRQRVSNAYQIIQNDKLKRCFNTQKRRRKEEAQKKRLYKSRIDKAIKFIEEKRKVFEWYDTDLFYLESLLKGDREWLIKYIHQW